MRRCGQRRLTTCLIGRRGYPRRARWRRCALKSWSPSKKQIPEASIVVYDLRPGSTPVTHRAVRRSGEDAPDEERPSEEAEPSSEQTQPTNAVWFLYRPTADIKGQVLIGDWSPPRAADNTEAVGTVSAFFAPPMTVRPLIGGRPSFPPANTQEWPTNHRPLLIARAPVPAGRPSSSRFSLCATFWSVPL